jgi:hypothetical protein
VVRELGPHAEAADDLHHRLDIANAGNVLEADRCGGQKRGGEQWERFVLIPARGE